MESFPDRANSVAAAAREFARIDRIENLSALRQRTEDLIVQSLHDGMPPTDAGTIVGDLNDALTRRLITLGEEHLAEQGLYPPSTHYCWLTLGSDGRREQLVRTDQDTALVYEDPSGREMAVSEQYVRKLADYVTDALAECGYARCPGGTMASNPLWCQPLARWFRYFHGWIRVPDPRALLNVSIFFDFRPVAGDTMLADELRHTIVAELRRDRTCLVLMAGHATRHPSPFTFFHRLAFEKSGAHAGLFDIKLRAMKPLVEAARVLAMDVGAIGTTNTVERFRAVAAADPASTSMCHDGIEAYEFFLGFRQRYGAPQFAGGRFLDLRTAPAPELVDLRRALGSVKRVMTGLAVRYQLDALRLR